MNRLTLISRSLLFHWRSHAAAGLASALGTAVLIGALLVGDSVRYSLKSMALERLGDVDSALLGGDRFFRDDLAERMNALIQKTNNATKHPENKSSARFVPMIMINGICTNDASGKRANQAQILGVSEQFSFVGEGWPAQKLKSGEIVLNQRLAAQLGAKKGDELRVRIYKPSLLSHDAPMGSDEQNAVLLRASVKEIIADRGIGRFGFDANQIVPLNAYLPIGDLQQKLEQNGRANVLLGLFGGDAASAGKAALEAAWTLDDAQLKLRAAPALGFAELSTPRVFLDDAVSAALLEQANGGTAKNVEQTNGGAGEPRLPQPSGVLTYFVNFIRANGKETPYSMVTAAEAPLVPADLKDDEIVLSDWTAEDLGAKAGDKIELEYFTVGLLRKLETRKAQFTVKSIVPMQGIHADKELMPEFPGIKDVDSTHDWDSSIPIDMKKIRDKDETYWKQHRGTPKAFIALKRGVELWKNRFGTYTAIRFPPQTAEETVRARLNPAMAGLAFTPVRQMALHASEQAIDFGMLFLGFSFFLITAALLLMALIFQFNVESRTSEIGVLQALGFTPRAVRGLLWREGVLMAALGSLGGVAGGVFYARFLLHALATRWQDAVGTSALEYHAEPRSIAIGCVSGIAVAALSIYFAVRRQGKLSTRELLASSGNETPASRAPSKAWLYTGLLCLLAAVGLVGFALIKGEVSAAGVFFGAGGLLLVASLSFVRLMLADNRRAALLGQDGAGVSALLWLGVRSASRRSGRSLATAALLACGAFLIVAVGSNRLDATVGAEKKESGTGGFAFYARATIPVSEDLNTDAGRTAAGVPDKGLDQVTLFPLRVKAGDEASCLNLNRAQKPRILGVPQSLIQRGGFTFVATVGVPDGAANPWTILNAPASGGAIPGICDFQSLTYALGKSVGDEIEISDDKGVPHKIRIVGAVANSILQGSVLISETNFLQMFPSESGYREFLIDAPPQRRDEVKKFLENALQDEGFDATPAIQRLAEFNAVQNTYLSTFEALGALGLLLGSIGLGIVVMRNVLERRSELALMRALGFSRLNLGALILSEHVWLLALGLGAGVVSAAVAVAPAMQSTVAPVPWRMLALSLAAVLGCGLLSALLATWAMLRAPLLAALRNE